MLIEISEHAEPRQRLGQHAFRQHTLNDVRAVQTVDAIRAEHTVLDGKQCTVFGQQKVTHLLLIVGQSIHQNIEPVPPHVTTFRVKIERLVPNVLIAYSRYHVPIRLLQQVLGPAMINLRDESTFLVF